MLQPRRNFLSLLVLLVIFNIVKAQDNINPDARRHDEKDVTTVLLVDSHGRSSFGRFLSVKPDVGLITSTARTFIQDGVTTEYATQVLGTTLDNGRLYAQLLTKSSRVLYNDAPSKSYDTNKKKWNLNDNVVNLQHFIKNTDYISPSRSEVAYVFPTKLPYQITERTKAEKIVNAIQEISDEEILKESPSNNLRVPFDENVKNRVVGPIENNNVRVFKISPQVRDITNENVIHKEDIADKKLFKSFTPSKVRPWDNLPTFTVRNEFSPSGLSFLGDFPDLDEQTERSKLTTPAERRAKFLFKAGLTKPNPTDLKSITYTGFADFTTTVGDTVIIFTPHTSVTSKEASTESITSTQIQPTTTLLEPPLATKVETFLSQEPPMETSTVQGHKLEMKTILPTMVIDKTDRSRDAKSKILEEHIDMDAMSAVLAHEQGQETPSQNPVSLTSEIIQPSETQPKMLSTPSDEDIAKIFASLQAMAKQSTEPLSSQSLLEESIDSSITGVTTIFFDDDKIFGTEIAGIDPSRSYPPTTPMAVTEIPTTNQQLPESTEKPTAVEQAEITTNDIFTTDEELSTIPIRETTPKMENVEESEALICTMGSKIVPTTVYKTLTYLTTFFITTDDTSTTSIKSNEVVSTETGYETQPCISPSSLSENHVPTLILQQTSEASPESHKETMIPEITTEPVTVPELEIQQQHVVSQDPITEPPITTEKNTSPPETTVQITTTEHQTEQETEPVEGTTEDGEEIELIFKTLYTTYTYLTTYFQESTTSIASRIVVTTNVVTSTLDPNADATDDSVAGLLERDDNLISSYKSKTVSFDDIAVLTDITPSTVNQLEPTATSNLSEDFALLDLEETVVKATPSLDDNVIAQNGIKTYYTTYTYFTTIFGDGETEISSRTTVYTNYVTPSAISSGNDLVPTRITSFGEITESKYEVEEQGHVTNKFYDVPFDGKYNTIVRHKSSEELNNSIKLDNDIISTASIKEPTYVTLQRESPTTDDNDRDNAILDLSEYETISTMVTDVRSSTSEGDKRIIDSADKRNILLDDQIVSESNNDSEILPSPTLLLQTSYTTFTYFTTMYHGTTSSNVVSRLETVTNVVTQTLPPTPASSSENLNQPITYFTTFTYWTTLFKDGTTTVTSREETSSNVETPSIIPTDFALSIDPTSTIALEATVVPESSLETSSQTEIPSVIGDDELTTYFTTFTYYTTSYIDDSTILNSRLQTITNVLNNSLDISSNQIGRAIGSGILNKVADEKTDKSESDSSNIILTQPTGLLSSVINTVDNDGTTTILSTDIYGTYIDGLYAKILESTSKIITETIAPSSVAVENLKPTGVVSINAGRIVDAEGVSTLLYTTQAIGTYIDDLYTQITQSTSSLTVDEVKKAALPTDLPIAQRTGLVRLIEGSIKQNDTTTLYQSKVLGTFIDGRYAQIIESTSSFLVGSGSSINPSSVNTEIVPTSTIATNESVTNTDIISPTPAVIEGSISESTKADEEETTEENEEADDNGRVKSRLTFQSRKRTFTPVIRPFASRQRPTFAPKKKQSGSAAATITRSDFTPTVTAIPASKPNRFGGRRSSTGASQISPTASGKRFSRPKSTSSGLNSAFGRRGSSRIQPTSTGFGASSRRGAFRSSSLGSIRPSASYFGARPRVRPTLSSGLNRSPSSTILTQTTLDDENDITTVVTDEPNGDPDSLETTLALQTTTEQARRGNNPLLRLRRPPLSRPSPGSRSNLSKPPKKVTTTTTTPRPRVTPGRPNSLLNRPRPNALFPRRGLFTTTTSAPEEEEEFEEDLEEEDLEGEKDTDDTDYDSSLTNTQTAKPPPTPQPTAGNRSAKSVQIKPFFRRRAKRDTYSRFRRPSTRTTEAPKTSTAPPTKGRFSQKRGKSTQKTTQATTSAPATRKRITPSKTSNRTPFTLREKDKRTSFKRPNNGGTSRPTTTTSKSRPSRLRNNYQTESSTNGRKSSSNRRVSTTTRGRTTPRQRYEKEDSDQDNFVIPTFDGTITVTHQIPTEVTIPVVNGKITEYKNVVTAQYSTEVLDPRQYSTSVNPFGKEVKVLLSENTNFGNNGATLITQFVLNEKPTSSVIFTPTYINRRKTSFSHIIPSTIYEVESVVNTIQPALAAQAPLANILLSQLLLGGLQPQANPLLGLQGIQQQGIAAPTPTTEFKTRTTTYVTTVTSTISTVLPLIFRGKQIMTTILDTSVNVVTATEFLTDTVVVTPAFGFQAAPQLNTALLLPLLQQQLQQGAGLNQALPQEPANVFHLKEANINQNLYQAEEDVDLSVEDSQELQESESSPQLPKPKSPRKFKKNKVEPPKETSVITLYVSGRTPGEFTTVLSTITVGEENAKRRKREIESVPVTPSRLPTESNFKESISFDSIVMPTTREVHLESSEHDKETESLESFIGDVSKHFTTQTQKPIKSSKKYKLKYVKASSEVKQRSSDNFLG